MSKHLQKRKLLSHLRNMRELLEKGDLEGQSKDDCLLCYARAIQDIRGSDASYQIVFEQFSKECPKCDFDEIHEWIEAAAVEQSNGDEDVYVKKYRPTPSAYGKTPRNHLRDLIRDEYHTTNTTPGDLLDSEQRRITFEYLSRWLQRNGQNK